MGDVLFATIEKWQHQSGRSWGKFLDSGTGVHSLKWITRLREQQERQFGSISDCPTPSSLSGLSSTGRSSLTDNGNSLTTNSVSQNSDMSTSPPPIRTITAITADEAMRAQVLSDTDVRTSLRSCDRLLVGNWMDEAFCQSLERDYDVILADYLIGAVDGFSPYTQDLIIEKLGHHLAPGGRLYIVGMQPIPDHAVGAAEIITEVRRARDASILLAGHRPYREYPLDWIERHLGRSGLSVVKSKKFTILHSEQSTIRQIKVGQSKLPLMPVIVRAGMERYLHELCERVSAAIQATPGGKIPLSFDYVLAAEVSSNAAAAEGDLSNSSYKDINLKAMDECSSWNVMGAAGSSGDFNYNNDGTVIEDNSSSCMQGQRDGMDALIPGIDSCMASSGDCLDEVIVGIVDDVVSRGGVGDTGAYDGLHHHPNIRSHGGDEAIAICCGSVPALDNGVWTDREEF